MTDKGLRNYKYVIEGVNVSPLLRVENKLIFLFVAIKLRLQHLGRSWYSDIIREKKKTLAFDFVFLET